MTMDVEAMEETCGGVQGGMPRLDSGLNILLLSSFPLLLWLFEGSFSGIATAVAEIWILSVALRMISMGQRIQDDYDAAPVAQRPRLPRKLLGSVLIGLMVTILAGHLFDALLLPLLIGLMGTALSVLAFGMDPLKDKGVVDCATARRMETDALIETAETRLTDIADSVAALGDAEMVRRTEAVRLMALRFLRVSAGRPAAFARVRTLTEKLIVILSAEVARLTASKGASEASFARRRYLAKLEVIAESFEARLTRPDSAPRDDAFDKEADRLLHRMPQESAA